MKIVFVSQNVSPGILIFRRELIKWFVENGDLVYCFAIDYCDETRGLVKELGAIPVDYKLSKAGFNPFEDFLSFLRLLFLIKKISPDVVFSFFIKPSIYGTLAATIAQVPRKVAMLEGLGYIYTKTNEVFSFKKKTLQIIHGLLSSFCYFFADKVVFLNKDDPVDLLKKTYIRKDKIFVSGPIGLDLCDYPHSPVSHEDSVVRFIFVARLLVEKGIFDYIEAAKIIKNSGLVAEFVVIGGIDYENPAAIKLNEINKYVEEGLILYPGYVDNVSDWVSKSHVFVLPSYREGYPRSTQEAMSIGRAILTTDVPGCRETVNQGVNGFIVPRGRPDKLAEKMSFLIKNRNEIKRMGEASFKIASSEFDINKIIPDMVDIIVGEDC